MYTYVQVLNNLIERARLNQRPHTESNDQMDEEINYYVQQTLILCCNQYQIGI